MESNYRHEDFQSSRRSGTMCHHRSLLVSIQAFKGGLRRHLLARELRVALSRKPSLPWNGASRKDGNDFSSVPAREPVSVFLQSDDGFFKAAKIMH
jgi:hypothetical protein